MFAHVAMDMRQAGKVLHAAMALVVTHARIPAVETLNDAHDAAAAVARKRLLVVVLVVGDEVGAVAGFVGAHGEEGRRAAGGFEGGADFGDEEGSVGVLEGGFGAGVELGRGDCGEFQRGCSELDVQQPLQAWNCVDRLEIEIIPGFEIANVPPKVRVLAMAVHDAFNEIDGWIGTG